MPTAKRKAVLLDEQPSGPPATSTVDPEDQSRRPVRANRGQGGHVANLNTFSKKLTDKKQMGSKTSASKELLVDAPVNPQFAPPEKKRRVGKENMPADPRSPAALPAVVTAPRPQALASTNGSRFGFIPPAKEPNTVYKAQPAAASGSRHPPRQAVSSSNNALPLFYRISAEVMKENPSAYLNAFITNEDGSLSPNADVHLAVAGERVGHMNLARLEFNPILEETRGPFLPDQEARFSHVIKLITRTDKIGNDPNESSQSAAHGRISQSTELSSGSRHRDSLVQEHRAAPTYTPNQHHAENNYDEQEILPGIEYVQDGESGGEDEDHNDAVEESHQEAIEADESSDDDDSDAYFPSGRPSGTQPKFIEEMEDSQIPFPAKQPSPAADDTDDGFDVLETYQKKNKPRRPPQVKHLAQIRAQQVQQGKPRNLQFPSLCDHFTNNDGDEEDSDEEDSRSPSPTPVRARRRRHTVQPKGPTSARNMSHYGRTFKGLLTAAKHDFCLYIATENPFPNREHHFVKATEFLTRRLQEFMDKGVVLDDHVQDHHMDNVVFSETSTFRGVIKSLARTSVKAHYKRELDIPKDDKDKDKDEERDPDTQDEEEQDRIPDAQGEAHELIAGRVRALLDGCGFHMDGFDENRKMRNFAHPAIEDLVLSAFYQGPTSLAALYPDSFKHKVPIVAHLLATTAIRCALEEWSLGFFSEVKFTAAAYTKVFESLMAAYQSGIVEDEYHLNAMNSRLRRLARLGMTKTTTPNPTNLIKVVIGK